MSTTTQPSLPGLERLKPHSLTTRNAFGRVPNVQYLGIDNSRFDDFGAEHVELASSSHLLRTLFTKKSDLTIDNLAYTPEEYAVIPRNLTALQRHASARAMARDSVSGLDEATTRAGRAKLHIVRSKLPVLENLAKSYSERIEVSKRLKPEIKNHWLAHMTEIDMRLRVGVVTTAADEILRIVSIVDKQDQATAELVYAAFYARLVEGKLQNKKPHWMSMVELVKRYNTAKRNSVNNKAATIRNLSR